MDSRPQITISASIKAPINQVWAIYNDPYHVTQWNFASPDWCCPSSEIDLKPGGKFSSRMEAKDGSMGFDFWGLYTDIKINEFLAYEMGDGRKASLKFKDNGNETLVTTVFEAEETNPIDMQQMGWQAILNNFKSHVESLQPEILHFEILINAAPSRVFKTMLDNKSYKEWTHVFYPGSYFEGSWEKGSKIKFIAKSEDGTLGGMLGTIADRVDDYHISIKYIGLINDSKEVTSGEDVDKMKGSFENYTFENQEGNTLLKVDMGPTGEYKSYFEETWPKALEKLKEICEK